MKVYMEGKKGSRFAMEQEFPSFEIETAISRVDDDRDLFAQLLDIYLRDTPGLISDLHTMFMAGDYKNASLRAHSLKSTSRTVGAYHLGMLAEVIECRLECSSTSDVSDYIGHVKKEYEIVKSLIMQTHTV